MALASTNSRFHCDTCVEYFPANSLVVPSPFLWPTVKYEDIYPKAYATVRGLEERFTSHFDFYCHGRIHQSLGYRTPAEVYGVGSR